MSFSKNIDIKNQTPEFFYKNKTPYFFYNSLIDDSKIYLDFPLIIDGVVCLVGRQINNDIFIAIPSNKTYNAKIYYNDYYLFRLTSTDFYNLLSNNETLFNLIDKSLTLYDNYEFLLSKQHDLKTDVWNDNWKLIKSNTLTARQIFPCLHVGLNASIYETTMVADVKNFLWETIINTNEQGV